MVAEIRYYYHEEKKTIKNGFNPVKRLLMSHKIFLEEI